LIYQKRDLIDKLIFQNKNSVGVLRGEADVLFIKRRQRAKALFYISNTKEPPIS
jgi:hypothetical protein